MLVLGLPAEFGSSRALGIPTITDQASAGLLGPVSLLGILTLNRVSNDFLENTKMAGQERRMMS